MAWVIENSEHGLGSFIVLLMIANYAKSDGSGAWPSIATIAKDSRLSETQTHRCIRKLQLSGELQVQVAAGPRGTNLYRLPMMRRFSRGSHLAGVGGAIEASQMAPEPLGTKERTSLPSASGGKQVFEWCRETVAVEMGRKKRLPSLKAYDGARAGDVVQFLRGQGFDARILECVA